MESTLKTRSRYEYPKIHEEGRKQISSKLYIDSAFSISGTVGGNVQLAFSYIHQKLHNYFI